MADYYRDVIRLLREGGYEFKRAGPWRSRNMVECEDGCPCHGRPQAKIEIHGKRHSQGSRLGEGILMLAEPRALPQVQTAKPLHF